jgi:6-phosphogluconolactonase
MKIRIFSTADELARATATLMAVRAARAIVERGQANLALAGGSTPLPIYHALATEPLRGIMPWQACHFFWSDERQVPFDHLDSNYGQAQRTWLGQVLQKPGQIHPIPVDLYEPEEAAARYQAELRTHYGGLLPAFDLILLGLGPDGHLASLFPQDPALAENRAWAAAVTPPPGVEPPMPRVTLTLPVLNAGRTVVVAVTGAGKRQAVKQALAEREAGPGGAVAKRLLPYGELFWFLDQEAAADL